MYKRCIPAVSEVATTIPGTPKALVVEMLSPVFFSLRHFDHLYRNIIKTHQNSIHHPTFSDITTELTLIFFNHLRKIRSTTEKNPGSCTNILLLTTLFAWLSVTCAEHTNNKTHFVVSIQLHFKADCIKPTWTKRRANSPGGGKSFELVHSKSCSALSTE